MPDISDIEITEKHREEAAHWFARNEGGSATSADKQDFETWLRQDQRNALAYQEAVDLWQALEAPAQRLVARNAQSAGMSWERSIGTPASWLLRAVTRHGYIPAGMTAIAALLVWIFIPTFFSDLIADHVSARGEVRTISLPDGSTMEMASNTAISLSFDEGQRTVNILRGQAYFDVRQIENGASFIVRAGPAAIKVTGTAFNIDRIADETEITVSRGTVEVSSVETARLETLTQGELVVTRGKDLSPVVEADMEVALSWRAGRLIFHRKPLHFVIEKLRRYYTGRIIIANPFLRDSQISGTFMTDNPETALETIAASIDAHLVYVSPWVLVIL